MIIAGQSIIFSRKMLMEDNAGGGSRTLKPVKAQVFETSAYTSSATPAKKLFYLESSQDSSNQHAHNPPRDAEGENGVPPLQQNRKQTP